MVRIQDIAQELNVTKSTVSKALNGADDISELTRKRVIETAIEMGYKKFDRKNMEKGKIAILIRNMEYSEKADFGYDLILGFRQMAEQASYKVDIIEVDEKMMKSANYDVFMMGNDYIGGFVLGFSLHDEWTKQFATCKTPSVLYDNTSIGNPNVTSVGVDSKEGMEIAIKHLCDLGHKKIAYLSGLLGAYYTKERYEGFKFALKRHGIKFEKELYGDAYFVSECVFKHLPRLIEKGVTAIVCSHDLLAHAVMSQCLEMGIRVPEDISCFGFDDINSSEYSIPPLTTIRQDCIEIGKSGYYALNSLLNEVPIATLLLHARLIERKSTAIKKEN